MTELLHALATAHNDVVDTFGPPFTSARDTLHRLDRRWHTGDTRLLFDRLDRQLGDMDAILYEIARERDNRPGGWERSEDTEYEALDSFYYAAAAVYERYAPEPAAF